MKHLILFESINKTVETEITEEPTEQVVEVIQNEVGRAAGLISDIGTRIKQGLPSLILAIIMFIIGIIAALDPGIFYFKNF